MRPSVSIRLDDNDVAEGDGNGNVEALVRFKGGEDMEGLAESRTEAVPSTCSKRGLITVLSQDRSTRIKEGSLLSFVSSDPWDQGKYCSFEVSCTKTANKMGPRFVAPHVAQLKLLLKQIYQMNQRRIWGARERFACCLHQGTVMDC